MNRDKNYQLVKKISLGVVTTFSDVVLYSLYLLGSSIGKTGSSRDIYKSFREADEIFNQYNTRSLINALMKLKSRKKYINFNLATKTPFAITKSGRKRLAEVIPTYKIKRPWNGKLYLVSYDIPEKKRDLRNLFRSQLKRLGGGLLQSSLWITPYDPRGALQPMLTDFSMEEWIITTTIDEKDTFTKGGREALIERVYQLSVLNKRYGEFIDNFHNKRGLAVAFNYLSILKNDPQLPFELEPKSFKANEAYKIYRNNSKSTTTAV